MKKIYILFTIAILSFFIVGCSSSGGGDDSPQQTKTSDNNTSEDNSSTPDNNTSEDNSSTPDSNISEDNSSTPDNNISDTVEKPNTTPTCAIGEKLSEDNQSCEKDQSVKAVTSGQVVDGNISGATISVCKILDSNKSEANATCSKTDNKGQFKCAIRDTEYDYLIFKAIGGKDLGLNSDSRDDKSNVDILKSILSKDEIENNKTSFVSPATTLVVVKASQNSWKIDEAKTSIAKALGTTSDELFNHQTGVKYATAVANIIDVLGDDINRSQIFITLSSKENIYTDSGVETGLLQELDNSISEESAKVLSDVIKTSVETPSDVTEKVIEQLADRIDKNKSVSSDLAKSFSAILENDYSILDDETISDFVADATEKGVIDDVNQNAFEVAKTIQTVINQSADKEVAKQLISDQIEKGGLDKPEELLKKITNKIVEQGCSATQIFNSTTGKCEEKPKQVKDEVDSPDDIPALPNDKAISIQEGSFPQIPSDNDYGTIDNLATQPADPQDNSYPDINFTSGENNQTTPYYTK